MADSSLEDFFAKKDKTKRKPKAAEGTAVAANTPSTKPVKREKKGAKKDKINPVSSSGNRTGVKNGKGDDDDWNDFEEVKAVDYSGLRIQNLQIGKDVGEREGEEEEYDEDGEVRERRDASGPWKKGSAAPPAGKSSVAPAPVETPKEGPVATPKAQGKYVPPAQRLSGNTSSSGFSMSRRKKEAPNLKSEVDFPTLGGGPQENSTAPSYVIEHPSQRRAASVTLENKFSALQD